jgi:F0F1-type ATP synthase assembly protein I
MPDDRPSNGPRVPIGLMVAGTEMVSFTLLGLLLDYAFGTMPGFTIGLTLLGLVAAFFQLTKLAKILASRSAKNRPGPPAEGDGNGGGP